MTVAIILSVTVTAGGQSALGKPAEVVISAGEQLGYSAESEVTDANGVISVLQGGRITVDNSYDNFLAYFFGNGELALSFAGGRIVMGETWSITGLTVTALDTPPANDGDWVVRVEAYAGQVTVGIRYMDEPVERLYYDTAVLERAEGLEPEQICIFTPSSLGLKKLQLFTLGYEVDLSSEDYEDGGESSIYVAKEPINKIKRAKNAIPVGIILVTAGGLLAVTGAATAVAVAVTRSRKKSLRKNGE